MDQHGPLVSCPDISEVQFLRHARLSQRHPTCPEQIR